MMYDTRIRTTFLVGIAVALLTACSPLQTLEITTLPANTATPLPPPQVIDLGTYGKGAVSDAFWSPDGKILAVRSSTGIYLHDAQTGEVMKTIPDVALESQSLGYPAFSTDGRNLTFVTKSWETPGSFWNYHLQTGELTLLFKVASLDPYSVPVFSPDGAAFAILNSVCENKGTPQQTCWTALELRAATTGQPLHSLQRSASAEDEVSTYVFSPNGKQIAVASKDNFARVWDTASGKLLYEFQHDSDVLDVAYSPDGRVIASASNDATVRFWDAQTGKNLFVMNGFTQGIQRVAYLDGGNKLLVGELSTNHFYEYALNHQSLPIESPTIEMQLGERRDPYPRLESDFKTAISPDGHMLAVLTNQTVKIWNLKTGTPMLTLPEYHSRIFTWAFNSDASMLAVADHNVHLWNVPDKKWLTVLPIDAYEIQAIAFSPSGRQLAVAAGDSLTIWDTSTFQKLHEVKIEHGADALFYAPDGSNLAFAGGGQVQILDATSGTVRQEFTLGDSYALALHFSADGKRLFYAGSIERLGWDLPSGKTLYSILTTPDRYGKAAMTSNLGVFWQWDSNHYYFDPSSNPQWQNAFHFFDPLTGKTLYDFVNPGDSQYITATLSANGRLLAWQKKDRIDLLDAASGQVLGMVDFHDANTLSLSPDSRILAAQSYLNPIHLWDVAAVAQRAESFSPLTATPAPTMIPALSATPTVVPLASTLLAPSPLSSDAISPENIARLDKLGELGLGRINTAAWSPDGKRFALGGYPSVYIFNSNVSQPVVTLSAEGEILKLTFSPDGKMLAGQITNSAIQVWDLSTGQSLYKVEVICWDVNMSFTTDGRILTAQCGSTTYRWDARSGSLIDQREDKNQPYGLISPDGSVLFERDETVARFVDARSKKIIQSSEVPKMMPGVAAFSPDGKTLMIWFYEFDIARSGVYVPGRDFNSVVQLWKIEPGKKPSLHASLPTGKWYQQDPGVMIGGYQMYSFTADSRRLATASGDGKIQIWSVASGKLLYTLPGGSSVNFSPNDNQLISLGESIQVWDVTAGKQPAQQWDISGLFEFHNLLAFVQGELVTADQRSFRFRTLDMTDINQQPVILQTPDHDMEVSTISPDGKWLAYRTATKFVLGKRDPQNIKWQTLENFADKQLIWWDRSMVFAPDGSMLAFIDSNRRILLWRLDDLESGPLELAHDIFVADLIFSPDSKSLLGVPGSSTEEQSLYLWDAATGNLLRTWKTRGYQFAFQPSGKTLALAEYQSGKISLYEWDTWKLIREMQGQTYVLKIAFSPDGRLLVTSGDKGIEIWQVSTGKLLKGIEKLQSSQLLFSPDGVLLAITIGDGRVQLWGAR